MSEPLITPLEPGLYIVATPIGNLADISRRAIDILLHADLVAVEDSRVTGKLLHHLGIKARMRPYHDHSSARDRDELIAMARSGVVALVSDAGTPLISDPGYKLVRDARAAGVHVTTAPGPSAAIAALTLSGLPTDRFLFCGFLPAREQGRRRELESVRAIDATLLFYESGPRLGATLAAMHDVLGARDAAVAREITKKFEQVVTGALDELAARYADEEARGEIVVIVGPPGEPEPVGEADIDAALKKALERLPVSKAAAEVAKATGADRKALYARALAIKSGTA